MFPAELLVGIRGLDEQKIKHFLKSSQGISNFVRPYRVSRIIRESPHSSVDTINTVRSCMIWMKPTQPRRGPLTLRWHSQGFGFVNAEADILPML